MTTGHKLGLLLALYFSQGLPYGFFVQALPAVMRKQGFSLAAIGYTSLLALPWGLKFLWAPTVDRVFSQKWGQRRSWIIPMQLIAAATIFSLSFVGFDEFNTVLVGVMLMNLFAATQDIATDGLAVDILDESERGIGNGVQVAGYRVGMIVGGGGLLMIYDTVKWQGATVTMAVLLLAASIPILLHKEQRNNALDIGPYPSNHTTPPSNSVSVWSCIRQKGMGTWLLVLALYKAGDALASAMLRPFLTDQGMTLGELGLLLGTVGFAAGLVGAVVGGGLTGFLGRKKALILFSILQTLTVASYALLAWVPSMPLIYMFCALEHFAGGMATAALFTYMMDRCRKEAAATDYTVQASLVVIVTGLCASISGVSADAFGYVSHFAFSGVLCLVGTLSVSVFFWSGADETVDD